MTFNIKFKTFESIRGKNSYTFDVGDKVKIISGYNKAIGKEGEIVDANKSIDSYVVQFKEYIGGGSSVCKGKGTPGYCWLFRGNNMEKIENTKQKRERISVNRTIVAPKIGDICVYKGHTQGLIGQKCRIVDVASKHYVYVEFLGDIKVPGGHDLNDYDKRGKCIDVMTTDLYKINYIPPQQRSDVKYGLGDIVEFNTKTFNKKTPTIKTGKITSIDEDSYYIYVDIPNEIGTHKVDIQNIIKLVNKSQSKKVPNYKVGDEIYFRSGGQTLQGTIDEIRPREGLIGVDMGRGRFTSTGYDNILGLVQDIEQDVMTNKELEQFLDDIIKDVKNNTTDISKEKFCDDDMVCLFGLPSGQMLEIAEDDCEFLKEMKLVNKVVKYRPGKNQEVIMNHYCFDDKDYDELINTLLDFYNIKKNGGSL